MRSTRKNQRRALVALALGFATAAIFATTASAGLGTGPIPGQYPDLEAEQALIQSSSSSPSTSAAEVDAGQLEPSVDTGIIPGQYSPDLEAEQALIQASSSPSTSAAEVDAGQLEPASNQSAATAKHVGPVTKNVANRSSVAGIPDGDNYVASLARSAGAGVGVGVTAQHVEKALANQSTRDSGPVFMNGVPDGYVGSGVEQQNLSGEGVTPTNLARAYHGDSKSQGVGPAFESKTVESASVSASSDNLDRGDLALGFGLGLILATAFAIALAMTRDRQHNRMAHS
jgi:hypothetical protein